MNIEMIITAFKEFKILVEKLDNRGMLEKAWDFCSMSLFGNKKICRY